MDKYGVGQDPYCYDGSSVFKNLLDIRDDAILQEAERELTIIAADGIPFTPRPTILTISRRCTGSSSVTFILGPAKSVP